jgi:hypothetical protein
LYPRLALIQLRKPFERFVHREQFGGLLKGKDQTLVQLDLLKLSAAFLRRWPRVVNQYTPHYRCATPKK